MGYEFSPCVPINFIFIIKKILRNASIWVMLWKPILGEIAIICGFLPQFTAHGGTWGHACQDTNYLDKANERGEGLVLWWQNCMPIWVTVFCMCSLFFLCLGTSAGSLKEEDKPRSSLLIFSSLMLVPVLLSHCNRSTLFVAFAVIFHSFIHWLIKMFLISNCEKS